MTHPLDDAFGVDIKDQLDDDFGVLEIPDDPTLDTIIKFALLAYKEQMEDIMHIEPKNRARHLEVAEKFLNQAKDAMAKKETIRAMREKNAPKPAKVVTPITDTVVTASEEEPKTSVSRSELLERLRVVK